MQFAITVLIEADNLKAAVNKVPDELGEVVGTASRPISQQPTVTSTFQNTQRTATPQLKGS